MNLDPRCVPCILNQVIRVAGHLRLSQKRQKEVLKACLKKAARLLFAGLTSPEFSAKLYAIAAGKTKVADPYRSLKKKQNILILKRIGYFRHKIRDSADPLYTAALYALLGNVIDYGGVTLFDAESLFGSIADRKLAINGFRRLQARLKRARSLLLVADNAGEAVLDRLFLEEISRFHPGLRLMAAVKSRPAINDITAGDARHAGLDRVAEIVPSGMALAGTLVAQASPRFKKAFREADVVIAKGQGNFETLEREKREIFFMFQVKCPVVGEFVNLDVGSLVLGTRDQLARAGNDPGN